MHPESAYLTMYDLAVTLTLKSKYSSLWPNCTVSYKFGEMSKRMTHDIYLMLTYCTMDQRRHQL